MELAIGEGMQDYLAKLRHCRDPMKAATYIRAFQVRVSAVYQDGQPAEALAGMRLAEQHAQTLERPWSEDAGPHPWRRWLREWGYV